jgi:hypothetical protein
MKGYAMSKDNKRKSPLELADLILEYNPGASMEMISNVISEWGGLFDDRRTGAQDAGKSEFTRHSNQGSGEATYCPHLPTPRTLGRQQ